MAINFPDNPTSNQIYSEVNKSWKWNGTAWVGIASTGPQGEPGPKGDIGLQGFVGETGIIQETQAWEDANYNFDQDYTNDTGAPLDIRLYVQNDNSAAGSSDISVYARINDAINISFVESFRLAGAGAHDDVGNITIPTGATFKFFGVTGGGTPFLAWKRMVRTQVVVEQQTPSVTGEATFQNEFNRILLSDVHLLEGLEVGDVIEVTGSNNGDNDKAFTVTWIGVNAIEVNGAHKNKTWTTYNRSLQEQTVVSGVTVTLACKAKNAAIGYGQAWVGVGPDRGNGSFGVVTTNSIGRAISVAVSVLANGTTTAGEPAFAEAFVDERKITQAGVDNTTQGSLNRMTPVDFIVPSGSQYRVDASDPGGLNDLSITTWVELR